MALYLTDVLNPEDISQLPIQFIRLAWQRIEEYQAKGSSALFIKEEFLPVLWWIRTNKPTFDKNQRRAGWPFWLNAYDKWVRSETQCDMNTQWYTASHLKTIEYGSHIVLPLINTIDLIEEAEAMHNCLADLSEDCTNAIYLAFSIRERTTWRNVATLGLELKEGHWVVDQVLEFANRSVGHTLRRAAIEVCNRVNASVSGGATIVGFRLPVKSLPQIISTKDQLVHFPIHSRRPIIIKVQV